MYNQFFKRSMDISIALFVLILFAPFFLVIACVLTLQNRGKAFFLQERPGKSQKAFHIIKFKSMTDARDELGNLLPDVQRITPFGAFVRKYSIDELPQLINVLKGDMSIIGPRPLLFKYIPLYSEEQMRRHNVRPGITGWAQVNGRNAISWTKKFELDIYYVNNISFLLDLKILYLTVFKVVKSEGINQSKDRSMQPFTGNN